MGVGKTGVGKTGVGEMGIPRQNDHNVLITLDKDDNA